MPNKPRTPARTFRLSQEVIDQLDRIALHLMSQTGAPHNRTDAIRYAARETLSRLRPDTRGGKKSEKTV